MSSVLGSLLTSCCSKAKRNESWPGSTLNIQFRAPSSGIALECSNSGSLAAVGVEQRNGLNDCTSLAVHGDESVFMSNPSDQYREDTRRRSAGEDGPMGQTPQVKDNTRSIFEDEVCGGEPGFDAQGD